MPMGRPKAELMLSQDEQSQLNSIARSRTIPAAPVARARILLAVAAGALVIGQASAATLESRLDQFFVMRNGTV
jgi:hypothetical protein